MKKSKKKPKKKTRVRRLEVDKILGREYSVVFFNEVSALPVRLVPSKTLVNVDLDLPPSQALLAAREALVEELVVAPRKPFEFLTTYHPPEPSTHPDERMGLSIRDMPATEPAWPGGIKQNLKLGLPGH